MMIRPYLEVNLTLPGIHHRDIENLELIITELDFLIIEDNEFEEENKRSPIKRERGEVVFSLFHG